MKKAKIVSGVGGLLLCLALFVYAFYPEKGIELSVLNTTGQSIHGVEFHYRGKIPKFDTIESGGIRFGKIMPDADGRLMLAFRESDGTAYSRDVDIYATEGDTGRIDVLVGKQGNMERRLDIQHAVGRHQF